MSKSVLSETAVSTRGGMRARSSSVSNAVKPAAPASANSNCVSLFAFTSWLSMSGLAPGGMFSSIHVPTHLRNRLLMTAHPSCESISTPVSRPKGLTDTSGHFCANITAQNGVQTEPLRWVQCRWLAISKAACPTVSIKLEGKGQPTPTGECAKTKTKVFSAIASKNRPLTLLQIQPAKQGVHGHSVAA